MIWLITTSVNNVALFEMFDVVFKSSLSWYHLLIIMYSFWVHSSLVSWNMSTLLSRMCVMSPTYDRVNTCDLSSDVREMCTMCHFLFVCAYLLFPKDLTKPRSSCNSKPKSDWYFITIAILQTPCLTRHLNEANWSLMFCSDQMRFSTFRVKETQRG